MRRPEQALQIQVAKYLSVALKSPTIWTAIGHGGGGKVRGAILKAMGVQAGWPDIIIIYPYRDTKTPRVLGLELKAAKGRQSPAQIEMQSAWQGALAGYAIIRSLDQLAHYLELCSVPLYARPQ